MKYRDCRGGKVWQIRGCHHHHRDSKFAYPTAIRATDALMNIQTLGSLCIKQIEQKCVKSHLEHAHGNQIRFTGRKTWNSVLCSDVDKDSD